LCHGILTPAVIGGEIWAASENPGRCKDFAMRETRVVDGLDDMPIVVRHIERMKLRSKVLQFIMMHLKKATDLIGC
jgi:hypothetical protein